MSNEPNTAYWRRNMFVFFSVFGMIFCVFARCGDVMDDWAISGMKTSPYNPPALSPLKQKIRTGLIVSGKFVEHRPSGNIVGNGSEDNVGEGLGERAWNEPIINVHFGEGESSQVFGFRKGFAPKFYRAWLELADYGCEAEIAETCRPFEAAFSRWNQSGGILNSLIGLKQSFKVGKPWNKDPRHGICSGIDMYRRCYNNKKVPLGIVDGKLAYIGYEPKKRQKVHALTDQEDIELADAYLKEEFADEIAQMQNTYGVTFSLEKYLKWRRTRALAEANGWVYGAHIVIFPFMLEQGLNGAFCGISEDPAHYQEEETDCDVGEEKWLKLIDIQREKNIRQYKRLPYNKFLNK